MILTASLIPAQDRDRETESPFAQPIATTVQLPTFGVSFNVDGLLEVKTFSDPTGHLRAKQQQAAAIAVLGELGKPADERKVSLVRLEAAMAERLDAGLSPTQAMLHLAGLTRISSAFCYPDDGDGGDIVVVGPAEPWVEDFGGVTRGIHSGIPTLRLDDLLVAVRAYASGRAPLELVGCSIGPDRNGLARLQRFQRTIPKTVGMSQRNDITRRIASGVRETLGPAEVVVFGIPRRTHFARVMIEADYRMKRMAIGIEKAPVPMITYADALRTASHGTLERWWLTPHYEGVLATPDRMGMQLAGRGVQLQTQLKEVNQVGSIVDSGRSPSRAATAYAKSFTSHYEALAQVSTVFAQLRQLSDLLITTAFMQRHRWYESANWNASLFVDDLSYGVETLPDPKTAPVVVNSFWKQNRMFVPVGGGVSIRAAEALRLIESADEVFADKRQRIKHGKQDTRWWWD
jgi:hypothetical protein